MVKKMMTNVFAVFVIFIVLAIIIPLPTPILDFLLIINIGLSLVILLSATQNAKSGKPRNKPK
ncbi:MAG: hypothetical protein ACLSAQ_08240 [[Eubacterium] siraeum]